MKGVVKILDVEPNEWEFTLWNFICIRKIVTFDNFIAEDSEGHRLCLGEEGWIYLWNLCCKGW